MKFIDGLLFCLTLGMLAWIPAVLPWSKMSQDEIVTWALLITTFVLLSVFVWTEPKKER